MKDNTLEVIKQKILIKDLAEEFNAVPNGRGKILNCKFNPLRTEKTCSLKLHTDTNTYADYGDKSGSVIDFYMKATGMNLKDTIDELKSRLHESDYKDYTPTETIQNHYMTDKAVLNAFNSPFHQDLDITKHKDHLLTICPSYLPNQATFEDKDYFFSLAKWSKHNNTSLFKLPDLNGDCHTFKYRYKSFGEDKRKWVSLQGARAKYAYIRLTENPVTLILEGTRDFLNAVLCGYSVIALPMAGYEFTIEEKRLLEGRKCVFMDDDDGKNFMTPLFESSVCDKVLFNHKEFKKITKCESKDFSDYLYQFKSLATFKETFDGFIDTLQPAPVASWKDALSTSKTLLTLETLQNAPDVVELIKGFIFKGTVTVLHSKPGQGKSTLLLGLLNKMTTEKAIDNFIYFDADNPMSVLKNRLTKLTETFGDKMIYHTHTLNSIESLREEMKRLSLFKGQGKNTFIVIDTLGKFVNAMKDEEVKPFMDLACELRDKFGATVVIVHHSNKAKDENDNNIFRGSTVISGDCDFMWSLQRQGKEITLKNDKGRFEYFEKIKTKVDMQNYTVEIEGSYDYDVIEEAETVTTDKKDIDLYSYLRGKGWIAISTVKKHFGLHRDRNDTTIWDMIKADNNIKYEKSQNGGWKCCLIDNAPIITEYVMDEPIYSEVEIPDIF